MKEGDIVKVYQDPVLCQKLDGRVELLMKLKPEVGRQEYWRVKFIDDHDNFVTDRWINVDIH